MVKKKKQTHNDAETEMMEGITITATDQEPTFATIRLNLIEINKKPNVTGYILRNSTSAVIDLKNPETLQSFAILSAEATETAEELSRLFQLGKVENILIEGKNQKIVCLSVGENKINVFMEKDASHAAIAKQLLR